MVKVLFISSVGGHLEQLLNLKKVISKYHSYIVTEKNPSTLSLEEEYENVYYLPFFSRKDLFKSLFLYLKIITISLKLYFKIKPNVIVTTGAGGVLPMCIIGKLAGCKVIYIETFSRNNSKTMTGSLCYHFADVFIIQWEQLREFYPKAVFLGSIY
ncbi:PssD/Cps14F family polysaccharide biosynthesis glycosyltransferase [Sinomicrobium oceani]|uniref:PssD/Cps14F family polysaccharide biosynthesis glycosyltransferase n=1 Tax=Sinomicrobium oceani TaxID=1150368 RepID=UPI00227D4A00|nr:PssD/Cps14F family polysaccharide biosynthesis glycosyltransferase [Sinomicrobium oceani]